MRIFKQTLVCLLLGLAVAPVLRGQMSLSLSPVQAEFALNPGKSGEQKLVVGNGSASPVRIKAEVAAWTMGRPGWDVFPAEGAGALSGLNWFRVDNPVFTVPAGESREMRVFVAVPEAAEPGQYTAAVSFQTMTEGEVPDPAGGLTLQGKLTALLMVTVGKPRDAGTVADVRLERQEGSAFLVLRRKNAGRFFLPTEGEIVLRDGKGKKIYSAEFVDDPVPPLSDRVFLIRIDKDLAPGRYQAECVLRLLTGKKATDKRPVVLD